MDYSTDHTLEITGSSAANIFVLLQKDGDKTRALTVSGDEDSSELIVIAGTNTHVELLYGLAGSRCVYVVS